MQDIVPWAIPATKHAIQERNHQQVVGLVDAQSTSKFVFRISF